MYPDHSLMPKEAVHLAALGILAEGPRTYAALADEVRDFTSYVMGPNLDLMGTSIQLLSYEGLITPARGGDAGTLAPDTELNLTEAGRRELNALLLAPVRTPFNDLNKLVVALKMRFFGLLEPDDRAVQVALITAALQSELARLSSLRDRRLEEAGNTDTLVRWLEHDLAQIESNLAWFAALAAGAAPAPIR